MITTPTWQQMCRCPVKILWHWHLSKCTNCSWCWTFLITAWLLINRQEHDLYS
jgi:hypothetical protein